MKTRRTLFFTALAFALALTLWAVLGARENHRLDHAATAAAERVARLESQVASATQRAKAAEERESNRPAAPALPGQLSSVPERPVDATGDGASSPPDPVKDLAARAEHLRKFRAKLDYIWGLLFQRLQLPPDQLEKFKDFLTRLEEKNLIVEASAAQRGLAHDAPEVLALEANLDRQLKAEIKALLPRNAWLAYREYHLSRHVLPFVDALVHASDFTPLTLDSAYQLMRVLGDSSQKRSNGAVIEGTIDWDNALARAPEILSHDQVATLVAIRDKIRAEKKQDRLIEKVSGEFEQKRKSGRSPGR